MSDHEASQIFSQEEARAYGVGPAHPQHPDHAIFLASLVGTADLMDFVPSTPPDSKTSVMRRVGHLGMPEHDVPPVTEQVA